ncbi:PREDICTED: kinesin-like protein KIF20A isoform X2 [Wasmannia auropunctata]|uniref:kinesin-like protein KIF20A isoform X2 n=1 Tax=Wasmannia auropunctata TaxID=64793 RepID=UPI0005F006B4|nr:PREDICTED: kinesin-like protein KIF20A isoform X2 [Wasmannia auropunctata]
MIPIRKNFSERPDTFANKYTQEVKTNYFFSLQCNKNTAIRFDTESRRASKISTSTIETYLRISPESTLEENHDDLRPFLTLLPFEDKFIRNSRCAKSSEAEGRRHVFTKIFGSKTSQAEMFEGSIKHRVVEFLDGKSSTIMTYGMRDSGKTYTLFGNSGSPGIITHSIELVFSAINCTIAPWYKPTFRDTVLRLNEAARTTEMQRKTRVLNERIIEAEARRFLRNLRPRNADPDQRDGDPDLEGEECYSESMYAVWLSFAEIYNGNVYDLLDDAERRSPLRLYVNTEGRTCVCGLQKVHVITALEACQILLAGRSRTSAFATGSWSSRSHTIFTMELLKYQKDHAAEDVVLSTLTFCDLAGSTQFEKSHKLEASSINNSLLVLGRCLKAMSQNQMAPFRQSNLTRICQRALSGEENLSIIVNVVFRPGLCDEIQSIFKFCDIVRKLQINRHNGCKQFCEFEKTIRDLETCDGNVLASPSSHQSLFETAETTGCVNSACKDIQEQNRRLKEELETVKSDMLNCEYTIRQQLADRYSRMFEELEGTYKENTKKIETEGQDLLKWSVEQVESFYKERIDNLMRRKKRKRSDSGDYVEDNRALCEEFEAENAQVTSKMVVLKETVKKLRKENRTILYEKNKCSFELALVTEELKKFRQLTRARIRKWGGNDENIKDDCLMNNLEQLMDEKVERAERKLEEMSEYIRAMENNDAEAASGAKQKLSKSGDLSNDTLNRMKELEEELLRKEACIIRLQHHSQLQERQLAEIQRGLNDTKSDSTSDGKCRCDRSTNISFDDYTADGSFQDNTSVEKNSPQMCVNSSINEQHEINDWIVVPTLFSSSVESPKKNLSNVSNVDRKSLFESSGSMDCSGSRSSERSSKDDSGVSSELRRSTSISNRTISRENEDKCTQTCVIDEDIQNAMEENVEQFKDSANLNKWNYQETLHVAELSQNLETIRDVIYALDHEAACTNEYQLLRKEGVLTEEENKIAIKRDGLFKVIENEIQEYKREIRELIRKLAIKEENESRIFKYLERYIDRSIAFENKLSLMRNRLDKAYSKCANEHLPKIESLEDEVLRKTLQINELDGRIAKMQRELADGYELFQKIHDFEIIANRCQRDKNELYRQLHECSETQLTLEDKLKKLTMKITERESEVISLKSEVRNIADLNVANSEKARNLSEQITEADESIGTAKEDLHCCQDLRKNVESTMKAEIRDFRSWFSDHKNNTALLNEICKTYDDSQDEITRLKMQLEQKELEAILLKTNRDAIIKKYEILMRHFQNEIEEKNKHFKTVANSSNNLERSLTENQSQPEETLKDHEAESSFASSSCFVPKHVSSEALNVTSTSSEDSITFSDEKD